MTLRHNENELCTPPAGRSDPQMNFSKGCLIYDHTEWLADDLLSSAFCSLRLVIPLGLTKTKQKILVDPLEHRLDVGHRAPPRQPDTGEDIIQITLVRSYIGMLNIAGFMNAWKTVKERGLDELRA
jgi:hypothetical protein